MEAMLASAAFDRPHAEIAVVRREVYLNASVVSGTGWKPIPHLPRAPLPIILPPA